MATFIADTDLLITIAAALKNKDGVQALADTPYWSQIATEANEQAYNEIATRLSARGFTAAQIAAWDRGEEWERKLGLYFALTEAALTDDYSDKYIAKLKERYFDGLDDVQVLNAGVIQSPAGTFGLPNSGPQETGMDLFVPIDPDDHRIGEPSEF